MADRGRELGRLRREAAGCRMCPLWERATQTVFGEGPPASPLMLVGEQPGDREDRDGRPFVGPAGRVLDDALAAAEVPRERVYVTNAVKHFKWVARGPRRIHDTPNEREVTACSPWLRDEIALIRPAVLVCLGATAAKALLGRDFRLTTTAARCSSRRSGRHSRRRSTRRRSCGAPPSAAARCSTA